MGRIRKIRSLARKGTSLGLGALATYFFDPEHGTKRRARALQNSRELWGRWAAPRLGAGPSRSEHDDHPSPSPLSETRRPNPVHHVPSGGGASLAAPVALPTAWRTIGLFSPRPFD